MTNPPFILEHLEAIAEVRQAVNQPHISSLFVFLCTLMHKTIRWERL